MNSVTAAFPDRQLHVILDNLNTHQKNEHWLKAHPNVQFHFTPTSASWLNQVEIWFSILQGQSLSGASFISLKQLQEHIDAYINAYNDKAEPFVWTKKKVRAVGLAPSQVEEQLRSVGPNRVARQARHTVLGELVARSINPLNILLLSLATASYFLGDSEPDPQF
jgi:magnesium-transporting ATPase (P-type)